ncbi:putative bifunctional diguanylate cyclase/phosphodiesterase [Azoarcus olearius]|uniref:Conserved hypothetical signaling protein n=1 Tax=Azoarcus sp. (strain BH72) TaxID=418699 RepID=A1K5P7_AZOSB|nr:EAL domain-containing protein [Azoarcus olearius]CAL94152.1 conserved hypothetical signaling protein [Azoarcus olearius]
MTGHVTSNRMRRTRSDAGVQGPARALTVLRSVNALISETSDEALLLREVCRIVAAPSAYCCVWVAFPQADGQHMEVVASWGATAGELWDRPLTPDGGGAEEQGLTGRLRLGWSWQVPPVPGEQGGGLAVLPLGAGSALIGGLIVGTADGGGFATEELALLHEAAKSLAYGIAALRSASQRAAAEAELRRVDRARRTLSAANRALVRIADEQALLDAICRVIVEEGGYRYAWVGYARHDEARGIDVMAEVGVDRPHLEDLRLTWADTERGRSATGTAIRSGRPSIGRNILSDPDLAPWRAEAIRRGYAAVSAFPLFVGGEVIGNLSIAAAEADAFDAGEAELLGELAADLAFGIETLRMRRRSEAAEATIKRMAEQDTLTGLPNRWRLRLRLSEAIVAAKAAHRPFALLMTGIDRFQDVNETLGYQQGDALLCEVAARLSGPLADPANIARVGEAEFAILLPSADASAAAVAAQRIIADMLAPVASGDIMLDAGCSVGIAVFPGHGAEPDTLIRRANVAMHQARQQGRGFALYTGGRDRECARRLALIGDLHRAIDNNELRLYCQPKMRFASGEICGVEALVRWQHPQLGLIQPDEFIGLAEHSGLIGPLTDWVMQAAFRQGYVWREAGLHLPLAVNLSARDLRDPRLLERVRNLLATWGGEPGSAQFELTESALMHDPQGSLDCLSRLRELGVELFIDDFGTGYSSLAYLQKLPVDAIKIDKSFVHDMLSNPDSAVIVRSTIDLAHDLELEVVAEGVEDRAGWEHLAARGCDVCQGYVVGQPVPAEAYTERLVQGGGMP